MFCNKKIRILLCIFLFIYIFIIPLIKRSNKTVGGNLVEKLALITNMNPENQKNELENMSANEKILLINDLNNITDEDMNAANIEETKKKSNMPVEEQNMPVEEQNMPVEEQNMPQQTMEQIKLKETMDTNSIQNQQLINIQKDLGNIKQELVDIRDNKNTLLNQKMQETLDELKKVNSINSAKIEENKEKINSNTDKLYKISDLNKNISGLYDNTNVVSEEDEQIFGGNLHNIMNNNNNYEGLDTNNLL